MESSIGEPLSVWWTFRVMRSQPYASHVQRLRRRRQFGVTIPRQSGFVVAASLHARHAPDIAPRYGDVPMNAARAVHASLGGRLRRARIALGPLLAGILLLGVG